MVNPPKNKRFNIKMLEALYFTRKKAITEGSLTFTVISSPSNRNLAIQGANVSFTAEYGDGTTQSFLAPTSAIISQNLSIPANTSAVTLRNIKKHDKVLNTTLIDIRSNAFVQEVTDWSTYPLDTLRFTTNNELVSVPNKLPPNFKSMYLMFFYCAKFNSPNVVPWNTSNIGSLSNTFNGCKAFNQPIGSWNTGNATAMDNMLVNCSAFNQSINSFDTSKVTTFASMLKGCTNYNQSNDSWNVSAGTDFSAMFQDCMKFNHSFASWNMANAVTISNMLNYCTKFNQNMSSLIIPASASRGGYDTGTSIWIPANKPQFV